MNGFPLFFFSCFAFFLGLVRAQAETPMPAPDPLRRGLPPGALELLLGDDGGGSQGLAAPLAGLSWEEITAAADGQSVKLWMWCGSAPINSWVNGWLAGQLSERYGISLVQSCVAGPDEFVQQILGERAAGTDQNGAVDLVWVNGPSFRSLKTGAGLYGPWSEAAPSGAYYDWNNPSIAYDFGFPVDGYEIPFGAAQQVFEFDSAVVPEPPTTMAELLQWIRDNPGGFTYPAPPDFTGSAFVRLTCYHAAGGYQAFQGAFDQAVFDENSPACWALLNEIEPSLAPYPDTQGADIERFKASLAARTPAIRVTYQVGNAQTRIDNAEYPESVRTFVLDDGTIGNTSYIAVAYNAPSLPAAVVTADLIASPDAQLEAVRDLNWLTPLDLDRLPAPVQAEFAAISPGPAVLSPAVLNPRRLPEPQADWVNAFEAGWEANVQGQ